MGSGLKVIPGKDYSFTWHELKSQLIEEATSTNSEQASKVLTSDIIITRVRGRKRLENCDLIQISAMYDISIGEDDYGLGIASQRNSDVYMDTQAYLEDFGKNLSSPTRVEIAQRWKEIGYFYTITFGGRGDPSVAHTLFVSFAKAIAKLVSGFVVISEGLLQIGTYPYNEFPSNSHLRAIAENVERVKRYREQQQQ